MALALDRENSHPNAGHRSVLTEDPDLPVLLVSGSDGNRNRIHAVLTEGGFACVPAWNPVGVVALIERGHFGLVVIEGRLNGVSATAFCQRIAPHSRCPVIVIDDGTDVMDRVIALETGADDYLSNPFNEREILARARALTRRASARSAQGGGAAQDDLPGWSITLGSRQVVGPGRSRFVILTPNEQSLLMVFLQQPGIPLTDELAAHYLAPRVQTQNLFRVAIVRLRRKLALAGLGEAAITTLRGSGYVFDARLAASCVIQQGFA